MMLGRSLALVWALGTNLRGLLKARGAVLASVRDEDVQGILQARQKKFSVMTDVWLRPLFNRENDALLGVLGIASALLPDDLSERERDVIEAERERFDPPSAEAVQLRPSCGERLLQTAVGLDVLSHRSRRRCARR